MGVRSVKYLALIAMSVSLASCAGTVVEERIVEVKVPVTVECVRGQRPPEVQPLKSKMSKEEWDALTTDQREKLLLAQASDRKEYGEALYVATSGCP